MHGSSVVPSRPTTRILPDGGIQRSTVEFEYTGVSRDCELSGMHAWRYGRLGLLATELAGRRQLGRRSEKVVTMTSDSETEKGRVNKAKIVLDEMENIIEWDAAAERLLGFSASEAVGACFSALFPREALPLPDKAQIEQHIKRHGFYRRYHIVRQGPERMLLAEVTAELRRGTKGQLLTLVQIAPVRHGSGKVSPDPGQLATHAEAAAEVFREFDKLLAALMARVSILGDRVSGDATVQQHVAQLRAASARLEALSEQLRALLGSSFPHDEIEPDQSTVGKGEIRGARAGTSEDAGKRSKKTSPRIPDDS